MSKKRNKAYKPKRVDPLSFDMAIRLVKPVEDDTKTRLSLDNHTAIEAFANGVADKAHFDTLAATVDVSILMLRLLFDGSESLIEEVKQGWLGLVRARDRFKTSQRLGLDGPAIVALKRVAEIYEEVISNVTGNELLKFYREREYQIRSGNYYKGTAADAPARIAA